MEHQLDIIARIYTDLPEKFGIPRQSGLAPDLKGRIVFEEKYRNIEALKGLDGYDYIWLLWDFEDAWQEEFRPTVRPPRLGGNEYRGVFATRSPFRPNAIGLSSVRLDAIRNSPTEGPVLYVSGIDMRDGTPIYDIKPYLPYVDSHPDARGGFTEQTKEYHLTVNCPDELLALIPMQKREGLLQLLSQDPRPSYHKDPERIYGVSYGDKNVLFCVRENVLTVTAIESV